MTRMPAITQSHLKSLSPFKCLFCSFQRRSWHPLGPHHLTPRFHTLPMNTCSQATGMGFKSDTMTPMFQLKTWWQAQSSPHLHTALHVPSYLHAGLWTPLRIQPVSYPPLCPAQHSLYFRPSLKEVGWVHRTHLHSRAHTSNQSHWTLSWHRDPKRQESSVEGSGSLLPTVATVFLGNTQSGPEGGDSPLRRGAQTVNRALCGPAEKAGGGWNVKNVLSWPALGWGLWHRTGQGLRRSREARQRKDEKSPLTCLQIAGQGLGLQAQQRGCWNAELWIHQWCWELFKSGQSLSVVFVDGLQTIPLRPFDFSLRDQLPVSIPLWALALSFYTLSIKFSFSLKNSVSVSFCLATLFPYSDGKHLKHKNHVCFCVSLYLQVHCWGYCTVLSRCST